MHLDVGFSDKKINDNYFEVLLPLDNYCKNYFDGFLYVYKSEAVTFEIIINYLLAKRPRLLNIGKIRFNKRVDALLCLLVNPYFDYTVDYLKNNHNELPNCFLKMLKKQVFKYLADEITMKINQVSYVDGSQFYNEHQCFQKSKEILSLLN